MQYLGSKGLMKPLARGKLGKCAGLVAGLLLAFGQLSAGGQAQGPASATPVPAVLVTPTSENAAAPPTATSTFSPTPLPTVRLQALDSAGNVNVRQFPDIESEVLGTIAHGTQYPVLRKYYRWYELRFDPSPIGLAWVYGDLVEIAGDTTLIEVIDNVDVSLVVNQALDLLAAQSAADEGGGSEDRTVQVVGEEQERAREAAPEAATRLPTFTPPAPTRAPFAEQIAQTSADDRPLPAVPPIVPIAALAGFGLAGLFISVLRR